jgi:hypothetical protein
MRKYLLSLMVLGAGYSFSDVHELTGLLLMSIGTFMLIGLMFSNGGSFGDSPDGIAAMEGMAAMEAARRRRSRKVRQATFPLTPDGLLSTSP